MYQKCVYSICLGCVLMLHACSWNKANQQFDALAEAFIQLYLQAQPQVGVAAGLHEYDGQVADCSADARRIYLDKVATLQRQLAQIDSLELSEERKIDYQLLQNQLQNQVFQHNELHLYERPMVYWQAVDITPYIKRKYASLEERAETVLRITQQIPRLLAQAQANMSDEHNFKEEINLAIPAFENMAQYYERQVPLICTKVYKHQLKKKIAYFNPLAVKALRNFSVFLRDKMRKQAKASFAIGREKYRTMLRLQEALTISPEELLTLGITKLREEQQAFAQAAHVINPKLSPQAVFRQIQQEHPAANDLVHFTRQSCEAIRQFVVAKQLVTVPSEVRAKVVAIPPFLLGATAAMDTPGAFEMPQAGEAYYYITPPSARWTPQQQAEWLTMFNRYTIEMISIHEAYPGHYVQFLQLKKSKVSKLRKLLGSYAFKEGWAHYTEQMMWEQGFGGQQPVVRAKYRMAQLAESLLRLCRLIVSIQQHTHGWSVAKSTQFFIDNAYYAPKLAYEEALRGTYDPGYLSYSLGKIQILSLRETYQKQMGKAFSLRQFHDTLISNGMLPLALLQKILLKKEP